MAPDATGDMGAGSSSKNSITLYSGWFDYSDPSRICRRYVADIHIPGNHQTPSGSSDYIELSGNVHITPSTLAECEATVVNARSYQRLDQLVWNGTAFVWNEGTFSSLGRAELRGQWVGNSDVLEPGGYVWDNPNFTVLAPTTGLQRRVARRGRSAPRDAQRQRRWVVGEGRRHPPASIRAVIR